MAIYPRDLPRLKRRTFTMSNATSPTGADPTTPSPSPSPTTSGLPTTSSEQPTGSPTDTTPTTTAPQDPSTSSPPPVTSNSPTSPDPVTTPTPTPEPTTPSPSPTTQPPTSEPPSTSSTPQPPTSLPSSTIRTTSSPPAPTTVIITETPSAGGPGSTWTLVTTVTSNTPVDPGSTSSSSTSSSASSTGTAIGVNDPNGGGALNNSGKIAVGVVVPIAAVALLVLAGIYFWRKRKQRKEIEEQRRKEVEDYAYNPNADPSIPAVGAYEMKDDSPGYRGWGSTTLGSSTGRKASTTMSGGAAGPALSDTTTPTYANISDTRSGEPLMDGGHSPEGEILGAMGPSAAANRTSDVHRGPSNASSSYSAAARSDGSGEGGVGIAYGSGGSYGYDQYGGANPYTEGGPYPPNRQGPAEVGGTPVIRDVAARRNTRIENPSHYPQQTAGISQNF